MPQARGSANPGTRGAARQWGARSNSISLDYGFFRSRVQPIFSNGVRELHQECRTGAGNEHEPLVRGCGELTWSDLQVASVRNKTTAQVSRIIMPPLPSPGHLSRLSRLLGGALSPPPGRSRIGLALAMGLVCHSIFGLAGLAMVSAMFFGMSESFGAVSWPWAALANAALIAQFPLAHSFFLTRLGNRWLGRLVPGQHGRTLATTTYAIIASLQLLALFTLWTPSGIVWWRADGAAFVVLCVAYSASWALLAKASFDAGAEVQSGASGWLSLVQNVRPVFPDMPTTGLFRFVRHPIYVGFTLTLWTVPVWTPDQLILALCFTAYCLFAPLHKERRFARLYGEKFAAYRACVPYVVPRVMGSKPDIHEAKTRQ